MPRATGAVQAVTRRFACHLLLAVLVASAAAQVPLPRERQEQLTRDALNAYDQALAASTTEPAQADALYRAAIAAYLTLRDSGIRSAALEYNLGNAYARLGDRGRAIAHYLLAQRLAPRDPQVTANCRYVAEGVEPHIEPAPAAQLFDRLQIWRGVVSRETLFRAAALLSAAGWLALGFALFVRRRTLVFAGGAVALLGTLLLVGVGRDILYDQQHPQIVIVDGAHTLRLGRGEGHDAALDSPLSPGVTGRVVQERGDWLEIQLENGVTGWIPASAAFTL